MNSSHHAKINGKWKQSLYLFYEEKIKFISYPTYFFRMPTHFSHFDFQNWVWTKTGTLWHFCIFMYLTITISNPFWGKFVSSVLSFTWEKNIFLSTTEFFLTPHIIYFLLRDEVKLKKKKKMVHVLKKGGVWDPKCTMFFLPKPKVIRTLWNTK